MTTEILSDALFYMSKYDFNDITEDSNRLYKCEYVLQIIPLLIQNKCYENVEEKEKLLRWCKITEWWKNYLIYLKSEKHLSYVNTLLQNMKKKKIVNVSKKEKQKQNSLQLSLKKLSKMKKF
jgi:hypothetical protein